MTSNNPDAEREPGFFAPAVLVPFMLVTLIWGSTWLVIRDQISVVAPAWSVTYRFLVAAIGMFALAGILRLSLRLDRALWRWVAVLGVLQFTLNFNFVYVAEHYITSGIVAVLFALLIVPNALLARWWLGRPIGRAFLMGSAIAVAGVALLLLREYRVAPVGADAVLTGVTLALLAVTCASSSNVIQALPVIAQAPIVTILAWAMTIGTLANAAYAALSVGPPQFDPRPQYLAGILYLGIIGSVVTFPMYFGLIRKIGPGKAAYTSVLIPVVAMLLSTVFENYSWSLLAVSGAVLVVIGLVFAMQASSPARKSE